MPECGPIALVGGNEFLPPARPLDAWLLERSGAAEVAVLPTAAARQRPDLAVATAARHFRALGAGVDGVMVLDRDDAGEAKCAARLARAPFVYLTGGDPDVLAETLRGTAVWEAVLEAGARGGVLAGSSAGAMALGPSILAPSWDEPVDGLGLLRRLAVVPHADRLTGSRREAYLDRALRVLPRFADGGLGLLAVDECTGVVLEGDGRIGVLGAGSAALYRKGALVGTWTAPTEPVAPEPATGEWR